jgi:D-cysteine desulfhydrase family pyridoxal phosphate-dependent enzyme
MLTKNLPRTPLAHLPTPLEPLPRFSEALGGPSVWIKRDDQTGLATGGNKARKLEFLVADALAQGATTLITAGAPQSNHARQTAAAAARCGLRCILVLGGGPPTQARQGGNVLLDGLMGADIRWVGDRDRAEAMAHVAAEVTAAGQRPYIVPYGGSNAFGASGYVAALEELSEQLADRSLLLDHVVFASSSGGTQAGLCVAAKALDFPAQIVGISVDEEAGRLQAKLAVLASETADHLGLGLNFEPDEFIVNDEYCAAGYGVVTPTEKAALRLLAQTEGILVDPVYTGRALAGMIDLIGLGAFDATETVCFWHTGGTPALFAYGEMLLE